MHHLVGVAIGKDDKFTHEVGMISRSYRATGSFAPADFDVHLPLAIDDKFELGTKKKSPQNICYSKTLSVWNDRTLPAVTIESKGVQKKFASVQTDSGQLSAEKLKQMMRIAFKRAIDDWNTQNSAHGSAYVFLSPN